VYVLVNDNGLLPEIYIGLADPIKDRLNNHYANKEFWEKVFVCVGDSDGKLNKALIEHIEARLILMARIAKQSDLKNDVIPKLPTLSASDEQEVEKFLSKLLFLFRVLGLNIFETPVVSQITLSGKDTSNKMLFLNSKGVAAKGSWGADSTFVVLADSEAVLEPVIKATESIIAHRKGLENNGVLKPENGRFVFSQNHPFKTPSAAAEVILGRAANGRKEWKDGQGKSINDLQAEAAGL